MKKIKIVMILIIVMILGLGVGEFIAIKILTNPSMVQVEEQMVIIPSEPGIGIKGVYPIKIYQTDSFILYHDMYISHKYNYNAKNYVDGIRLPFTSYYLKLK